MRAFAGHQLQEILQGPEPAVLDVFLDHQSAFGGVEAVAEELPMSQGGVNDRIFGSVAFDGEFPQPEV